MVTLLRDRQFPDSVWQQLAPFADGEFVKRGEVREFPLV